MKNRDRKPRAGRKAPPPRPPTPKQKHDWDVPPRSPTGDPVNSTTFQAVGEALSQWEYFEAYFGHIFGHFVGSWHPASAAMRAYGSVLTFRGRKEMMEAAAEIYFLDMQNKALEKSFSDLVDDSVNFAARRNEIAHGIVQPYYPPTIDPRKSDAVFALMPSRHATNKHKRMLHDVVHEDVIAPTYVYSSAEIKAFGKHFNALGRRAWTLWAELRRDQLDRQQASRKKL